MACGHSHKEIFHPAKNGLLSTELNGEDIHEVRELNGIQNLLEDDLFTSYLGKVSFNHDRIGDEAYLQTVHKVANMMIGVKIIDYKENKMSMNRNYSLQELVAMKTKKISVKRNQIDFIATLLVNKKIAEMEGEEEEEKKINKLLENYSTAETITSARNLYRQLEKKQTLQSFKKIRKEILSGNSCVDIMFNTINYLDFLYQSTGIISVNNLNVLVSVCNVPELDNAFFTGKYMVYGEGKTLFTPLVSIDVIGHELSHGLVSGTAGLVYQGHSGALNESFADIMGTMFEFYMYKKYNEDEDNTNDILGNSDWKIGEDLGMNMPYLRSMSSPESARQPSRMDGKFYMNPKSRTDNGGVHINSGIPNYCFYIACQKSKNKTAILKIFTQCLKRLSKKADFKEFAQILFECSSQSLSKTIYDSLSLVGLSKYVNLPAPEPEPAPEPAPEPEPAPAPDNGGCECRCRCDCKCNCCFCKRGRL